ncbi:MAG: SIR2 family protein [Acetobacter sp.]|nr:SIR2 family protein [Acetobacter sp.]
MIEKPSQDNDNNSDKIKSISDTKPPFSVPFSFRKGGKDILEDILEKKSDQQNATWKKDDWQKAIKVTQDYISAALNAKRVSFLLGAGCSSFKEDNKELGIPTMVPMAQEFINSKKNNSNFNLLKKLGIDIQTYNLNLEPLMEVLFSAQKALQNTPKQKLKNIVDNAIKDVKDFILNYFQDNTNKHNTVINLYQQFYQKLIFRDRALPRPWIFTTNYDLFNEQAMDRLGIPYCNGFSGVIERYFNPSVFRYSLGQQLDISSRHWEPVDHFVYLCKLHGSISWQESEENTSLFPIKERQPRESDTSAEPAPVLIYPTPMKQSAGLGSPYVDLFREFHKQIVCEQSVLFAIGYSFSDEHINNIIFQALTIPNFRLIILIDKDKFESGVVKTLFGLNDPRIWIISDNDTQTNQGTDKQKAYHFETFIKHFMPVQPKEDSIDEIIRHTIERLLKESKKSKN